MVRFKTASPRPHYDAVLLALHKTGGVVEEAARLLRMDGGNLRKYIRGRPRLQEILGNLRADMCDRAERCVSKAIDAGDLKAALYTLSTLGRSRGYQSGPGSMVNLGDTTNLAITSVTINAVETGKFVGDDGRAIEGSVNGEIVRDRRTEKRGKPPVLSSEGA